jgi:hypothetical protein
MKGSALKIYLITCDISRVKNHRKNKNMDKVKKLGAHSLVVMVAVAAYFAFLFSVLGSM